jgi:hypothetical protein
LLTAYLEELKENLQDAEPKEKYHEDISKVIEKLAETHTNIAANPKLRKRTLYLFCKHLALKPEAFLDLLRDIQNGNDSARGLLDNFLNKQSAQEEPAPTPAPANLKLSTGTTTTAPVAAEASVVTTPLMDSTFKSSHKEDETTQEVQPVSGRVEQEDVIMEGEEDSGGVLAREEGGGGTVGVVGTETGGEPGLGSHTPSTQDAVPPDLPSIPDLPSTQASSAVSIESQTTCPTSEISSMTPSTHAPGQNLPLPSQ